MFVKMPSLIMVRHTFLIFEQNITNVEIKKIVGHHLFLIFHWQLMSVHMLSVIMARRKFLLFEQNSIKFKIKNIKKQKNKLLAQVPFGFLRTDRGWHDAMA